KVEEIVNKSNRKLGVKYSYKIILKAVQLVRYLYTLTNKDSIRSWEVEAYIDALNKLKIPPDVIIPVCFPFESVKAALLFKENNNTVDVLPYLLDKFSVSTTLHRTSFNRRVKMERHLSIERELLEKSLHILTTEDWRKHL